MVLCPCADSLFSQASPESHAQYPDYELVLQVEGQDTGAWADRAYSEVSNLCCLSWQRCCHMRVWTWSDLSQIMWICVLYTSGHLLHRNAHWLK